MNIEEINKSLNNIQAALKAADGVIRNPMSDFGTELSKQSSDGKRLANIFLTQGAALYVEETGASSLSSGITSLLAGLGAFGAIYAASGPIGWAVGGAVLVASSTAIFTKVKAARKAREEKERMKNEIIRKQQAIIGELKKQNANNAQEIKNLKETLTIMEKLLEGLNQAA